MHFMPRTNKDAQYVTALRDYWRVNKTLPSFAFVGELLGMSSTASIWTAVRRLVKGGYLVKLEGHVLAPGPRFFESDATSESSSESGSGCPFLTQQELANLVRGESDERVGYRVDTDDLISHGIPRGAVAVIDPLVAARPGDVIAMIASNRVRLQVYPRNRRTRAGWTIVGVVVLTLNRVRST
jgi:hypothetical protein